MKLEGFKSSVALRQPCLPVGKSFIKGAQQYVYLKSYFMFIISFAIFTFILTVFENIFLAFWILILILVWNFIRKKIHPDFVKTSPGFQPPSPQRRGAGSEVFLFIVIAFLLSLASIFIKNYTYSQKVDTLSNSTWIIYQDMDGPQWQYFIGTGIISDIYSYQRYIFEDNQNREYFLNSSSKYQIGDVIWLNWYVSIAYTWSKNIFDIHRQWQTFKQKPEFSGFFNYEFNYPKWLMMKWFYGTIYEQISVNIGENCHSVILSETKNPEPIYTRFFSDAQNDSEGRLLPNSQWPVACQSNISFLQKIRKNLQKNIISAYGENPQAGLILWMLVWDKSQIPPDQYQWFIDSWLVHIIAVSGGNIIMIVVFLWAILFFVPFYARSALILLTIILYAMICGMDSSVFRATIMWWLWMLALFRWREINIRRAMSIAFISMLTINPYFLSYDVWFLLSFSAIIGIIYFGKFTSHDLSTPHLSSPSRRGKESINAPLLWGEGFGWGAKKVHGVVSKIFQKIAKEYITPTIWATLWVLPIMLFFMWKTNLTWIIANFLVVPIIAIVMIYWFISTILFQIIAREIWLRPEKILINYIYSISDLAVKWWVYLQAEWAWIKYVLLWLFVLWLLFERGKKPQKK